MKLDRHRLDYIHTCMKLLEADYPDLRWEVEVHEEDSEGGRYTFRGKEEDDTTVIQIGAHGSGWRVDISTKTSPYDHPSRALRHTRDYVFGCRHGDPRETRT